MGAAAAFHPSLAARLASWDLIGEWTECCIPFPPIRIPDSIDTTSAWAAWRLAWWAFRRRPGVGGRVTGARRTAYSGAGFLLAQAASIGNVLLSDL